MNTATTLVSLFDANGPIWTGTIDEFLADNADAYDAEAGAAVVAALAGTGECTVGGAVAFTLRVCALQPVAMYP